MYILIDKFLLDIYWVFSIEFMLGVGGRGGKNILIVFKEFINFLGR